jgi:hypothetical protein
MKVDPNSPLSPTDTENQTYGCRYFNPNMCMNYHLVTKCAFVRKDKICLKPPNTWNKKYQLLKESQ